MAQVDILSSSLVSGLAGTGTEMVVANATGQLFRQAIPGGTSITDYATLVTTNRFQAWHFMHGNAGQNRTGGIRDASNTGTITLRNWASTNYLSRTPKTSTVSTATAGSITGYRNAALQYCFIDGFNFSYQFVNADAATVSGARSMVGMISTAAALTNANPSSFSSSLILLGNDTGDTNFYVIHGSGSGNTKINLGASYPCNTINTDIYTFNIQVDAGATSFNYRVIRQSATDGSVLADTGVQNVATTIAQGTGLAQTCHRNNNTTALAVTLDHMYMTIEAIQY